MIDEANILIDRTALGHVPDQLNRVLLVSAHHQFAYAARDRLGVEFQHGPRRLESIVIADDIVDKSGRRDRQSNNRNDRNAQLPDNTGPCRIRVKVALRSAL